MREAAARTFVLDAIREDAGGKPSYAVTVTHGWSPGPGLKAQLRLLSLAQPSAAVVPADGEQVHTFRGIPLADVTPYLVLTLEDPEAKLAKSNAKFKNFQILRGGLLK